MRGNGTLLKKQASPKKGKAISRLSPTTLSRMAQLFQHMADESRLKILFALGQEGELTVTDLCQRLNHMQPAVSHHLMLLRLGGLVNFRRHGKHIIYRLDGDLVVGLLDQLFREIGCGKKPFTFSEMSLNFCRKPQPVNSEPS